MRPTATMGTVRSQLDLLGYSDPGLKGPGAEMTAASSQEAAQKGLLEMAVFILENFLSFFFLLSSWMATEMLFIYHLSNYLQSVIFSLSFYHLSGSMTYVTKQYDSCPSCRHWKTCCLCSLSLCATEMSSLPPLQPKEPSPRCVVASFPMPEARSDLPLSQAGP